MKYNKGKLTIMLLLAIVITGLQAQEGNPATGGKAAGSGGSVSYTVGQVAYTTNIGTTGSVAQGVQQPFEISVVAGIEEAKDINLMVTVYPNPSSDYITLKVESYNVEDLLYQLFDLNGKLLENKILTGNETKIDMNNLVPATYYLKIIQNENAIKTFQIIKY
jgi:hypothetical protein